MTSRIARLVFHERALLVGVIVAGAICAALGVPFEFVLFGATLAGVAVFHRHTLQVALSGLAAIVLYKLAFTGFKTGAGFEGLGVHLLHEWVILANLLGLLLGFALLSRHFEESGVPAMLPRFLPDDWKGGFVLLVMIFVLSSFLDNIAAALIGGTVAGTVFRHKVHIGYLAAIVAASNAGGSGSVIGDTTTTMMWIDGVDPLDVLEAFIAAGTAMAIFGVPAALQQHRYSPIVRDAPAGGRHRLGAPHDRGHHPSRCHRGERPPQRAIRRGLRTAFLSSGRPSGSPLIATALWRKPDWSVLPGLVERQHLSAVAHPLRFVHAGREAARRRPGSPRLALDSSRQCSTTSR